MSLQSKQFLAFGAVLFSAACTTTSPSGANQAVTTPPRLDPFSSGADPQSQDPAYRSERLAEGADTSEGRTDATNADSGQVVIRQVPNLGDGVTRPTDDQSPGMPALPAGKVDVTIPPQSLPEFVNTVFGELLGTGFVLGPGVAERQDIVSYRSARNITPADLYESASKALRDYGIAVTYENGQVTVQENNQLLRSAPQFIRSRARSSVPAGLRPVVQFVELFAIDLNEMAEILKSAFPDQTSFSIQVNRTSNSLTLSGLPEDIDRALQIVNEMDELRFAGTEVATYRVRNWEANQLATILEDLLQLEGYSVTSQRGVTRAITIKPIEYTQQVVIFARQPEMLRHALESAQRLDKDAQIENVREPRVYKAQYYKAEDLIAILENADSLNPVRNGVLATGGAMPPAPDPQPVARGENSSRNFVADPQGNRIIFSATDQEYSGHLRLLRQLDTPADEVLIEVTIAEVTLTDDLRYGVEFLFDQIGSRGYSLGFGTLGGLGLATGGASGRYTSGDYTVDFGAMAENNQINVLSTPRLVTKSGSSASIQVGTDVPIITSQTAAGTQAGGTTDILQSVDYRKTGILLDIEPLVLSGNRIDLKISQEVSSAQANANQAIASPVISNRSINTELTLQDGQSAILGGLIENRYTRGTSGIPFLKDLPLIGGAFSTETLTANETVLLVMITPYIMKTRTDRAQAVEAMSDAVNEAFLNQVSESKTLRKPTVAPQLEPRYSDD